MRVSCRYLEDDRFGMFMPFRGTEKEKEREQRLNDDEGDDDC